MDFTLTDDQKAIGAMAYGLFQDFSSDAQIQAFEASSAPFMTDLWHSCVETGLHALAIPESLGGSGLGMTELYCVLKAQGAGLGLVPLWEHQLAACALAAFGTAAHTDLLKQAAAGEVMLSVGLNALNASVGPELTLREQGEGYVLHGVARVVPYGICAQRILVLAYGDSGYRLALVDPHAVGIEAVGGRTNHGQEVADLHFSQCALEGVQVLPLAATAWLRQRAIAAVAALQLGVSEEQIRRTADYLQEREQFGRAIGAFQAVQMTMADCHIAVEASRSTLLQLLYRLDAGLPSPSEALSTRILSAEAAHLVGHKAQHVHGGVGVDLTYPIHRFLYWSRHLSMVLGSPQADLERLGDWLANNDKLGWKYDLEEHQIAG